MNLQKTITGATLFLMMTMNACSQESRLMTPTHIAQVNLAPERFGHLVERLDVEMKASRLTRRGGVKGLPELKKLSGRDIAFYVYEMESSDKGKFMELSQDITELDVINGGSVEMEVYSTVIADEKARKDAMTRVKKVLAEHGVALKELLTNSNERLGQTPIKK